MKKDRIPIVSVAVSIAVIAVGAVVAYLTGRSLICQPANDTEIEIDDDDDDEAAAADDDDDTYAEEDNKPYDEAARSLDAEQYDFSKEPQILSKKGMKKQMKYERKVQNRRLKKQKERQKRHEEALRMGRDIQKEQELVAQRTLLGEGWKRRQEVWEREKLPWVLQSFHVCIDCSYESYMTTKEITSLAAQIRCCYAYNKRNDQPCQLVVTNLSMPQSPKTLQLLQQEKGYNEWENRAYTSTALSPHEFYSSGGNCSTKMFLSTSETGVSQQQQQQNRIIKIVYLTSDSENTLLTLENDAVYVIGGIVDRNRHKGIAYARALSLRINENHTSNNNSNRPTTISISTAKLPLLEYIAHMPSTPVLTINHVFHILLQYRNHNNDWNAAFKAVLPARKEAQYIYQ